jgi:hypothetical protein
MKRCFICERIIWPWQWSIDLSIFTNRKKDSEKIAQLHFGCFNRHIDLVRSGIRKAVLEHFESIWPNKE